MGNNKTPYSVDDLQIWIDRIEECAQEIGLDFFPQEFELCDHEQMMEYMAYHGMPYHYPHWSFGKAYDVTETQYRYGAIGLPYEMVINSNPSLAYLMANNSLLLQILTIAHVYGHNHFFKNNSLFEGTRSASVRNQMRTAEKMVQEFIDDPLIGIDKVERILDAAHAIMFHGRFSPYRKHLTRKEQVDKIKGRFRSPKDPHATIHPEVKQASEEEIKVALQKVPLEPTEDILLFIRDNNPRLEEWERQLLTVVLNEVQYFTPQLQTRSLNEGCACIVHYIIMNMLLEKGYLQDGMYEEFMVYHNRVIAPIIGGVNLYCIGFNTLRAVQIWYDGFLDKSLLERQDKRLFEELSHDMEERNAIPADAGTKTGWEKLLEIWSVDRDTSFFRQYLSLPIMRKMHLFSHAEEKKSNGRRIIVDIVNQENWKEIKDMLTSWTGENVFPKIKVEEVGSKGTGRALFLKHYIDSKGRELRAEYAEKTIKHIAHLWMHPVMLYCAINENEYILMADSKGEKVQTKLLK